jgi:hypothetical protein
VWYYSSVISELGRLRQEDHKFEGCLGHIVNSRQAWAHSKTKEGTKEERREGGREGRKEGRRDGRKDQNLGLRGVVQVVA